MKGLTPLHLAAWRGHVAEMHLLITKGAYWNIRDNHGSSPFLVACRAGHVDCMGYLLACACTVDARTNSGDTALHLACLTGTREAVELILNQVPQYINARNYAGDTPCDVCDANDHGVLLQWLKSRNGLRKRELQEESEEERAGRISCERREEEVRREREYAEQQEGIVPPSAMPTE